MSEDLHERVIKLEVHVTTMNDNYKDVLECYKETLKTQQKILDEMIRYKGFIGGIAFIASGLGILVVFLKDWFWKHFVT